MVGGRRKNGRKPNALNTQIFAGVDITVVEIIKTVDNAPQITDAIGIGIGKRAYKNLIKGALFVRIGVRLCCGHLGWLFCAAGMAH